jgi:hypothetical protein
VTITVTQEIIETSIKRESQHCPIAETIAATVPRATNVLVDTATIRWTDPDKGLRYIYLTPIVAREAIFAIDRGDPVEPFAFYLRSAQVRGVRRKDGVNATISFEDWKNLKEKIRKICKEKGKTIASVLDNDIHVPRNSLYSAYIPIAATVDKIEEWILKETGEKPTPRIKSQAERASGKARIRSWNPKKAEFPEIIGGAHPPVDFMLSYRQYGLRALRRHWRVNHQGEA